MISYGKTQLGFVQNVTTNSIAEDSRSKNREREEREITMGNNGGFKSDNSTAIGQSVRNLWRNLD